MIYIKTKDFFLSKEEFSLHFNKRKGILKTYPIPRNLQDYYNTENYISHNDKLKSLKGFFYKGVRRVMTRRKIKLLQKINPKIKSLLDIGAGTGDFVLSTSKRGWDSRGVEPNDNARKLAIKKGIKITKTYPQNTFDVISMWHVLEHVFDIEKQIDEIKHKLNPKGLLVIAVPNYKSYGAKHYKEYWAAYDVPRHIWHFSREGLVQLMEEFGFCYVTTKPMPFDALYVSVLSEGYCKNRWSFFRGVLIGLYCNWKALRTKEYSSNIFVFEKE